MSDGTSITGPTILGPQPGSDGFSAASCAELAKRGMTTTDALEAGLKPVLTTADLPAELAANSYAQTGAGILFPWPELGSDEVVWQFRPDFPRENPDGDAVKYVFGKDVPAPVALIRAGTEAEGPVAIVEGSFQSRMAAKYAPEQVTVLAISGCWNFGADQVPYELACVDERQVVIVLDADAATNHQVYAAGQRLETACLQEGASSVTFTRLATGGTNGLDDVLARKDPERRAAFLGRLLAQAKAKPADRAPKPTKSTRAAQMYLDDKGAVLPQTLATDIIANTPALLHPDGTVAFYEPELGFYRVSQDSLAMRIADVMGDLHRSGHVESTRHSLGNILTKAGAVAPARADKPVVCLPNGMLDLVTGELFAHDPAYLAMRRLAATYDPKMPTPFYDAWVHFCGLDDQLADLEEVTAQMLDPSRTPQRALFLFGPRRSGKSTWLRLMQAVAGEDMTSAVSLHDMADSQYAQAMLHGKVLNSAGELSSREVSDVATFKKATGEDAIHANRKYGRVFTFTNQALFAFSANEVPAINDPTGAAVGRIKPFLFSKSFYGREDPRIEAAMLLELPGILARWRAAWVRRNERGVWLDTRADVAALFLQGADQVRAWVAEAVKIHHTEVDTVAPEAFSQGRDAFHAYRTWATDTGRTPVGERRLVATLKAMGTEGIKVVRRSSDRREGFNITTENGPSNVRHLAIAPMPRVTDR